MNSPRFRKANEASRDPDDLYGDSTVAVIEIRCRRNGSMSVAGDINNLPYALAMLDNAKDTLRNHHSRQRILNGETDITPAKDAPTLGPFVAPILAPANGKKIIS